jgi:hypothetical protein
MTRPGRSESPTPCSSDPWPPGPGSLGGIVEGTACTLSAVLPLLQVAIATSGAPAALVLLTT